MSEHQEQATLFKLLKMNEARIPLLKYVFAIPNGGQRNKGVAAKLKAEGVKAGVHDIFLPLPMNGYHGMFIEMKFGRNGLTAEQSEFGLFAASQNYHTVVCYSWVEATREIEKYLGIDLTISIQSSGGVIGIGGKR